MPNVINNWPNADLHNLNLDWILNEIKKLGIKVSNAETYIPHVSNWNNGQWDVNHEYSMNEIVFNGNEIYLASKNVPPGVNINDTAYWALVGTDSYITTKVDKAGDTMTGNLDVHAIVAANGVTIRSNTPDLAYTNANGVNADGEITFDIAANDRRFVFFQHQTEGGTYEEYVLPKSINLFQNAIYEIITTKQKIAWNNANDWQTASNNAKMDICLVFDNTIGGTPVRFNVMIPVNELTDTKWYYSTTAYTSGGEAYVALGADFSTVNCQMVIAGVGAAVSPSAILYR